MKIIGHIILASDIARVHMNIALSTKTETKTLAFVKVKIKKNPGARQLEPLLSCNKLNILRCSCYNIIVHRPSFQNEEYRRKYVYTVD